MKRLENLRYSEADKHKTPWLKEGEQLLPASCARVMYWLIAVSALATVLCQVYHYFIGGR